MAKSFQLKLPKMDKILKDKNVLYTVFVIAILNLLGYLLVKNVEAVAFFLVIGFLTTYFSKNMIVVLMVAIISTSVFASTRNRREGMSTRRTEKKAARKEDIDIDEEIDIDLDKAKAKAKVKANMKKTLESQDNEPTTVSTISSNKKNRVDYAGTLEEAYKNLQNTVGEGGIEGLTGQTETLLTQQKELMDNIQGMQPFLKTADSFMKNLDMSSLEGITGMLGKLTGKQEE